MVLRLDRALRLGDLSRDWAWGGAAGAGVRVAVIDSGVEANHPALEGCVDVVSGVAVVLDAWGQPRVERGPHDDAYGHGTACASIVHRLAPQARIVSVRVLGGAGSTKAVQFLTALEWAVTQGFEVINLSLGTTAREHALAFHDLCDQAYFSGSLVVTAANNVLAPSYPSLYASVLSVASNTARDPFRFHYNPDPPTEFLAPGVEVDVAWKGGGRTTASGNSYAAPHIAGVAALIKSKHPDLLPFQLKTVLWATSANVIEAGAGAAPAPAEFAGRVTRTLAGIAAERRTSLFLRRPPPR
ncbi:MAG: S8 family serine peptidase [Acidimicrobiales bacterium]